MKSIIIRGVSVRTTDYRKIAELMFAKKLLPDEVVHHIDGDHNNNDPSNLVIMKKGQHSRVHGLARELPFDRRAGVCQCCLYVQVFKSIDRAFDDNTHSPYPQDVLGLLYDIISSLKLSITKEEFDYEKAVRMYALFCDWKKEKKHDCQLGLNIHIVPYGDDENEI